MPAELDSANFCPTVHLHVIQMYLSFRCDTEVVWHCSQSFCCFIAVPQREGGQNTKSPFFSLFSPPLTVIRSKSSRSLNSLDTAVCVLSAAKGWGSASPRVSLSLRSLSSILPSAGSGLGSQQLPKNHCSHSESHTASSKPCAGCCLCPSPFTANPACALALATFCSCYL